MRIFLRAVLLFLIAANIAAVGVLLGWWDYGVHKGEARRLTTQVAPEAIRLVPPNALPPPAQPKQQPSPVVAPPPAPPVQPVSITKPSPAVEEPKTPPICILLTGLSEDSAEELASLAEDAPGKIRTRQGSTGKPTAWWVRIPPTGSREAAEKKVEELKAKEISEYFIVHEAGVNQYAISLGLFKSESSAQNRLASIKLKGINNASVVPRNSPTTSTLELKGTQDTVNTFVRDALRKYKGVSKAPCK